MNNSIIHISDSTDVVIESIENPTVGLPTGISALDKNTCGLEPNDYILVAGRPSMGKTSYAIDLLLHIGVCDPILFFSLEMGKQQILSRCLCNIAKVHYHKIRIEGLTSKDTQCIKKAADVIKKSKIYIDDSSFLSPTILKKKLIYAVKEYDIKCIIIDYIQLMSFVRGEDRQQEVSDISRELKAIAKDFGIPVVVLCQLNRSVEQRDEKRPRLSDLRESGSLEQDADKVIMLYRQSHYDMQRDISARDNGEAEFIIVKNRNGPTGTIRAAWISEWMSFLDTEGI